MPFNILLLPGCVEAEGISQLAMRIEGLDSAIEGVGLGDGRDPESAPTVSMDERRRIVCDVYWKVGVLGVC